MSAGGGYTPEEWQQVAQLALRMLRAEDDAARLFAMSLHFREATADAMRTALHRQHVEAGNRMTPEWEQAVEDHIERTLTAARRKYDARRERRAEPG